MGNQNPVSLIYDTNCKTIHRLSGGSDAVNHDYHANLMDPVMHQASCSRKAKHHPFLVSQRGPS